MNELENIYAWWNLKNVQASQTEQISLNKCQFISLAG